MTSHEDQIKIRLDPDLKKKFLALHERLGSRKLEDTLAALLKANSSGSEKALRVVELEAQIQSIDEAFKETVQQQRRDLQEAQEKVNRATASRKAAHNKYHALIRHLQNNVPRNILANMNLSKFMEQPQQHLTSTPEPKDDVGEQLEYLARGEHE